MSYRILIEDLKYEKDILKYEVAELKSTLAQVRANALLLQGNLEATERELDRWRHGTPIEGDFICPNELKSCTLERLRELCRGKAVSMSFNYEECSDLWFGEVSSASPKERGYWKKVSYFEDLVEYMSTHVRAL